MKNAIYLDYNNCPFRIMGQFSFITPEPQYQTIIDEIERPSKNFPRQEETSMFEIDKYAIVVLSKDDYTLTLMELHVL